jgi:phosphoribosylamine---glycine ligase
MATVLVIGSGAREHAIAWKLSRSPHVKRLIVAPGNDGMSWERWPAQPFPELAQKSKNEKVDLVVVGPDNALSDGIVDEFQKVGIACFGPTAAAAQIEASKSFAKEIMRAADVPTARFATAFTLDEAISAIKQFSNGCVIKADGLALGKGVIVCSTQEEAQKACEQLYPLSKKLVIEEKLSGQEISWLAFCDGENCALLEPARDYKRVRDGDQGPNTGGMGAFSPVEGVPASWEMRVKEKVFLPVLKEMKKRGTPFKGVLYAGLMVDFEKDRFYVLEFNARFGDPETQVLLPRMKDDLYLWCDSVAKGKLLSDRMNFISDAAVYVVGAAKGYPENPEKGKSISGLETPDAETSPEQVEHFVAGVSKNMTSGGRVFGALGLGKTIEEAREKAYTRLKSVSFEGLHYRSDIGL